MIDIQDNVSSIGLKISGGVDSSLLAFLYAKTIADQKLRVSVTPIVIVEQASPFQLVFSTQVLSKIEDLTSFRFESIKSYECLLGEDKIRKMRDIENHLKGSLDLIASATTQYPRDPSFVEPGGPDDDRCGVFDTMWDGWIYTPFINHDKRDIAKLYREHGLIETILPLTRSCVQPTQDFTKVCGKCWWCKERAWAFDV